MMIQLQKVVEFGKEGDKEEKFEHEKRHSKFFSLYFPYPEINILEGTWSQLSI